MKPAYFPRDDVEIARMTRCPSLNRAATGIKTIPFRSLASPPLPTSRGAIPTPFIFDPSGTSHEDRSLSSTFHSTNRFPVEDNEF